MTELYTVFGKIVSCPFPFPEFRRADGCMDADLFIRKGSLTLPSSGFIERRISRHPCHVLYRVDTETYYSEWDEGLFLIRNGSEIIIDPDPTANEPAIRSIVIGLFGELLRQQGYLVVHSSSVRIGDTAVLFAGGSEVGKSTTLAAFIRRGYQMIADDISAIRFEDDRLKVMPSYPSIRLDPAIVNSLDVPLLALSDQPSDGSRLFHRASLADDPVEISKLFILEWGNTEITSLEPREQFDAVITNSYFGLETGDNGLADSYFGRCATLVDHVPVRVLRRERDLSSIDESLDLIEEAVTPAD